MKKLPKKKSPAEKLRIRLFFYLSSALLVMMLGLTGLILLLLFDHMKLTQGHNLEHVAEIRSIAVSEWCRRTQDILKQVTSRTRIREELEKYNNGSISKESLDAFTSPKLQDALNISSEIIGIIRFDRSKNIVAQCGPSIIEKDVMVRILKKGKLLSKPYFSNGYHFIVVNATILNRENQKIGSDLAMIDLSNLKKIVTESHEMGKTIEVSLGYSLSGKVYPVFKDINKEYKAYKDEIDLVTAKAIDGFSGILDLKNISMAYFPVSISGWGLTVTQNEKELYSPLYRKILIICIISSGLYFLILSGFWLIMRPMAGKILMHADDLEKKIREKTITLENEISVRKKIEKEKVETIAELMEAFEKIKQLRGLIPICAHCKKIRDDKGYWNQIESYISKYSEAEFSHGICPDCASELYPDLKIYNDEE